MPNGYESTESPSRNRPGLRGRRAIQRGREDLLRVEVAEGTETRLNVHSPNGGFHKWGIPQSLDGLFHGEIENKMDDLGVAPMT